jgi:glycosyltransferase involved in cell wall biosynthesis
LKNSNGGRPQVLIFSPRPSGGGGVDNFVQTLRRKLASEVEAELFLIGQPGSRSGRWLRPLVPIYDAFRLAALLVRRRHDVYHLNPSLLPQAILRDGLFLLVLRLFRRRNVLVFIHGWSTAFYRRISDSPIRRALFRFAFHGAAHIIVLASTFKTDLAAIGIPVKKIGVHTTMFDGELLKSIERDRKDNETRILFMARLVAAKGIYELLEAFRNLSGSDPTLILVIAGDGPESARAQLWCQQHNLEQKVRFAGFVEGTTKAKLLVDADIFALPTSHGEGCPVALL